MKQKNKETIKRIKPYKYIYFFFPEKTVKIDKSLARLSKAQMFRYK